MHLVLEKGVKETITEKDIWNKAIQLLSRREYSRAELVQKLARISQDLPLDAVLGELESAGYLSDRRFAESFIRMRVGQGHGLIRIRFDLQRKGVANDLLQAVLEEMDIDWFGLAAEQYQRKYSQAVPSGDYKERSKRMRFLSQRGFTMDEIQYALDSKEVE